MSIEHRTAVVKRYIEALARRDLDGIAALFAADARVEDPVGSAPVVGIDAIREFYRVFALPQIQTIELTGPVRCPEKAAAFPFRVKSPGGGGAAAERFTDIIDVFDFDDDGRVISMKAYWTPF